MKAKKVLFDLIYIAVAVAIILSVWAVCAAFSSSFVLPQIDRVLHAFKDVFNNPEFWRGLGGTLTRSCVGYAISVMLFFVTYSLSVCFMPFARVMGVIVSALRSLPAVALSLVLILAVGGSYAPIVLGVVVIYPILYSSGRARTATVASELKEVCRLCGAGRAGTLLHLYLPTLAAGLPESMASAFSYNIKAVIGAEILAQSAASLGVLMQLSQLYLQPALLIALVLVAVVVAAIGEAVIRIVLRAALDRFINE